MQPCLAGTEFAIDNLHGDGTKTVLLVTEKSAVGHVDVVMTT